MPQAVQAVGGSPTPPADCTISMVEFDFRQEQVIPERIPYAREPRKLPVVLSPDEVVQFLEAVSS